MRKTMPKYNHKKCEDNDDAVRMAETILRKLGFNDVQKGTSYFIEGNNNRNDLIEIAKYAERIARWARQTEKDMLK
jgi:hypothetical protein